MADVRALLRQQRAARRVDHPHAVYSDAGKLSCAVCREPVRPESAWGDHLRSAGHRQHVRVLAPQTAPAPQKRRHSETEDGDGSSGDGGGSSGDGGGDGEDEPSRKKQHRPEGGARPAIAINSPETTGGPETDRRTERRKPSLSTPQAATPQAMPPLGRRSSGTPAQGVEMRIPSRPATPIALKESVVNFVGGNGSGSNSGSNTGGQPSAASTPKTAPLGRSPLIPQEVAMPAPAAAAASGALAAALANGSSAAAAKTKTAEQQPPLDTADTAATAAAPGLAQADIDEDEWAAFEAEVVNAPAASKPAMDMNGGLVASAGAVPPATADLTAVEGDDEQRTRRRAAEEARLADEKEEATRALQDELEDMQALESRVQKLKAKREALRGGRGLAPPAAVDGTADAADAAQDADEAQDSDSDDSDDADWDAFRFKA